MFKKHFDTIENGSNCGKASQCRWMDFSLLASWHRLIPHLTVSSSPACHFPIDTFPLIQDAFLSGKHITSTCFQLESIS